LQVLHFSQATNVVMATDHFNSAKDFKQFNQEAKCFGHFLASELHGRAQN